MPRSTRRKREYCMTVSELYRELSRRYPDTLRAEWDHDGLMVCPDTDAPVRRVLCTLDITGGAVEYACREGYDVILSHHPLLFHPVASVTPETVTGKRLLALIGAGISVLSFHTRADAANGGVNDLLAEALGLSDVSPFGDGTGRIGSLPEALPLSAFADLVRAALACPAVLCAGDEKEVRRVAVLGGSGKEEIPAAHAAGADVYLSGRLSYESVNEAAETGMAMIEAGHFYTEDLLPKSWAECLPEWFPEIETGYYNSCGITVQ